MPLASLWVASTLVLPAAPQAQPLPFPFSVAEDLGPAGLELSPRPELLGALQGAERVRLEAVPLPGGELATLELTRTQAWTPEARLWVDGEPAAPLSALGVSLWAGEVHGVEGSDVFLALSPRGSRGWIDLGTERLHLLAGPDAGGSWESPRAQLVPDGWLLAQGREPDRSCEAAALPLPGDRELPLARSVEELAGAPGLLAATVAVESDHQFYEVFGDEDAAAAYALAVLGAVSARYQEQIGVVLDVNYLGLHARPEDPWRAQDLGGSCLDVLFEFQEAGWENAPVHANLYHFLSGADLGCGVAYLWGLCDPDYKYSVSGNLSGLLEFPVVQGPVTWDFIVVAHEIGHLFGAPHTHDWCPPIDQCAPDWAGFGACQTEQVCLSGTGTLMSYCHLCAGGYENVQLEFHPTSARAMRQWASSTCLLPAASGAATATAGGAASPARPARR